MSRKKRQLYPDFRAFVDYIDENGVSPEIINKILTKHRPNAKYNEGLYQRYMTMEEALPIMKRQPRFDKEENPINNKINHDHFGNIIDFKVGYFAGAPATYSYSKTEEAEETTGGTDAIDKATKALTDFTTRNNMHGVDMETTKFATTYGYSGRLLYIDPEGDERVMPVHGYECVFLSKTSIAEPKYSIRYYETIDINDSKEWVAEFYDNTYIYTFKGMWGQLAQVGEPKPHMFDYCPLQGIANNEELMGDAEKVLAEIDDYDKTLSDNSNEIETFAHAYMVFEGVRVDDDVITKGRETGAFNIPPTGMSQGKVYYLTKDINDSFTEHHLDRLETNIHEGSKTPNLKDAAFGTASGVALKFKILGLETKCGMAEAKKRDADYYMFKVLASSWKKKTIEFDPLQAVVEYKRNFPVDSLSEAQTAQAQINAGLPKEWVYGQMAQIDDVDYIMELREAEKAAETDATPLYEEEETGVNDKNMYKVTSVLGQLKRGQLTRGAAMRIFTGLGFTEENAAAMIDENDDKAQKKKEGAGAVTI